MIKECKILRINELVMVIEFDGNLIQMPSVKTKNKTVFVKCENGKYTISNEDEYKKSLIKEVKVEKKEYKREMNDDK